MAAAEGKAIITCAVTGSIHTPSMSPHLPVTPAEIARAAIGAAQAGAAIVHLHAQAEHQERRVDALHAARDQRCRMCYMHGRRGSWGGCEGGGRVRCV